MLSEEGGRVFSECYQRQEEEFSPSVTRGKRKSFLGVLSEEGGIVFSECFI